jgi:hypothetical protein
MRQAQTLNEAQLRRVTLLRKSADERISPFPRQIYPTAFVTGMPRAV